MYSLYTYDCLATHASNSMVKFADDTAVIGLITGEDETLYLEEVERLTHWCQDNSLLLNTSKTKEMIVDFRLKGNKNYAPLNISGTAVERVTGFKYLGVHLTENLSWSKHTDALVKKSRQRMYHLRRLRTFRVSPLALQNFYTCTIESILTGSITTWYGNCTVQDQQALQRVVRTAGRITGGVLPSIQDIYTRRCRSKTKRILEDNSHPAHGLFDLLNSGKRYRILKASQERYRKSFYPHAIRILNEDMELERRQ